MSQKRSLFLALVIGLLSLMAVPTFAQDNSAPTPLPGTIRVSGTGSVNTAPDTATVIVGVTIVDSDLKSAYAAANDQVAAIITAVQEAGVAVEDIRTFGLNIYQDSSYPPMPMDGGQTDTAPELRYNVSNQVSVKVRDISKIADVINAAVDAGANNLFGLEFSVDDYKSQQTEARKLALEDARAKAAELAAAAGVELGDIVSISEFSAAVPFNGNMRMDMGGSAVIQPGQQEIQATLDVTFEIKR
jgi:uncharacterized protein YggE